MAVPYGEGVLFLIVLLSSARFAQNALTCLKCNGQQSLSECHDQDTCQTHEKCFVRRVHVHGRTEYFSGCTRNNNCDGTNLTPNINHGGKTVCHRCCANHSACSLSDLCPDNDLRCLKCNGQRSLKECHDHEKCGNDQKCFVRKVAVQGKTEYFSGCVKNTYCDGTNLTPDINHGGRTLCHKCCANHSACSLSNLCPEYLQAIRKCQVCSGQGCKGHVGLAECGDPFDLCLTSVANKEDGTQIYSKRCATVNECNDRWLKETALKPECVGFHPDLKYKFNFNCTFCCKTDGCNRNNIPAVDSLYLIG